MQKNPFDQFDDAGASNPFNTFTTNRDPLAVRRDERASNADDRAANADARAADAAIIQARRANQQYQQDAATWEATKLKAEADARKAVADAAKAERENGGKKAPDELAAVRAEAIDKIKLARSLQQRSRDGWFTTGFGAGIAGRIGGTPAYDLAQDTETLKNAGALTRIMEMARESGGKNPLTPLSNSDFRALASSLSNLETGQSDDQYQRNVQRVIDLYERAYKGAGGTDLEGDIDPSKRNRKPIPGAIATGRFEAATGANRQERDPVASGIIDRIVRQGGNLDTLNTTLANLGYAPVEQKSFDAARQHFKQNPTYTGSYGDATRTVENTTRQQIAGSAPGAFAANAFNDVAAGIPGAIFGTDTLEAQRRANPNAALAGSIVGGAIGSGAMELGLGRAAARLGGGLASRFLANPLTADALYGGIQGGATDGSATGALAGAGLGAAGGAVGRGVVRGIGAAARGVTDPSVQYLRRLGVPLTAAQSVGSSGFLGRTAKGIEDRLTGVPVIGDIINARRLEGFQGFNRAAFDEGLAPITPQNARPGWATNGATGEQGVEAAQTRVGDAFSNALDNVQLQADLPFTADMRATLAAGQALPEPMAGNARYTLNTRIGNSFDNTGGLTGRDFQQSIRGLRRDADAVANQPYGYDFGQVTRQGEAGLEGLLQRQSPGTLPAYNAANRAFRQTEVLRDAVTRARNGTRVGEAGLFAPSQLADAATANARRFGNANGTTNQPFFDLARAGQNVLPSRIADSGAAGRLAIQGGLGLGVLGGGGYAVGGSDTAQGATATGLGLGALLAAGGTRAGQRAITRTLLDRPDYLRRLGNEVIRRNGLGGMFGTAAALPLLTYD